MDVSDGVTFVFSLLALAPLAERLGFVTEQLALHTNDSIGGLLNATFGNATELIVAITALARGLFRLVQLSLLGSVLSNLLLVLGTAFLVGGYYKRTQRHETVSAQVNSSLLMISVMGIVLPNVLSSSGMVSDLSLIGFSRGISMVLFFVYVAFLFFQLKTHTHLYEDQVKDDSDKVEEQAKLIASTLENEVKPGFIPENRLPNEAGTVPMPNNVTSNPVTKVETNAAKEEDEEEEEDLLGFKYSLVWLAIITTLIAILSDAISATISNAASSAGISNIFLAAIILPIVGNAAEHAGAIMFAAKDRLDLTLGCHSFILVRVKIPYIAYIS